MNNNITINSPSQDYTHPDNHASSVGYVNTLVFVSEIHWTTAKSHSQQYDNSFKLPSIMPNASVNSSCAHPPPGNCGAFACLVSPGGGALANLARPGDRAFAYPRAFDTHVVFRLEIQTWRILSQRTSSSSQIGSSAKDWTNLWRFSRFYAFLHCSSRHNYHLI